MSQPTVSRIWKAFGLKAWLDDTFKFSTDPLLGPPERRFRPYRAHHDLVGGKTAARMVVLAGLRERPQLAPRLWPFRTRTGPDIA
jgi:hypothetical protein